mgnify:CR=1 FL=1
MNVPVFLCLEYTTRHAVRAGDFFAVIPKIVHAEPMCLLLHIFKKARKEGMGAVVHVKHGRLRFHGEKCFRAVALVDPVTVSIANKAVVVAACRVEFVQLHLIDPAHKSLADAHRICTYRFRPLGGVVGWKQKPMVRQRRE